jgi:hypothetical protein
MYVCIVFGMEGVSVRSAYLHSHFSHRERDALLPARTRLCMYVCVHVTVCVYRNVISLLKIHVY